MGPALTKVLTSWNDVKYVDFIVIKQNVWPSKERKRCTRDLKISRKRRSGCVGSLSRLLDYPLVNFAWAEKLESPNAPHQVQSSLDRWIPTAILYFCEMVTETSKQLLVSLDMFLFAISSARGDGTNKQALQVQS
ncbi:uncharacterized protein [Halyomorpha halys]|uniref:uncharacterized protein n=1 Tax=Halyomorpha halys TaxID=286706 RepID=UPI0006D4F4D3|nr:uncharacterized protein LOC106683622 [Halyomorpha halys]